MGKACGCGGRGATGLGMNRGGTGAADLGKVSFDAGAGAWDDLDSARSFAASSPQFLGFDAGGWGDDMA